MKTAVLCCLVVLSLGLSAAPVPVAADVSMGSMLSVFTRGLLSVDASKKVCISVLTRGSGPAAQKPPPVLPLLSARQHLVLVSCASLGLGLPKRRAKASSMPQRTHCLSSHGHGHSDTHDCEVCIA